MIQSQMVTPPLAAMDGTTLRLKTATTKSSTRSRRPSARIRWGWAGWAVVDTFRVWLLALVAEQQVPHRACGPVRNDKAHFDAHILLVHAGRTECPPYTDIL